MLMTTTACMTTAQADRLSELQEVLAANDSATLALEQWCARHEIADPPEVKALPVVGARVAIPEEARTLLDPGEGETIAVRHVMLVCGDTTLSLAWNYYVPERLTEQMNTLLNTTDLPFGRVVSSLGYRRERLDALRGSAEACPAETVLSHRALLRLPDDRPLSFLAECYTPAALSAAD